MAKHGGVFMTNVDGYTANNAVPAENIGGLLFDIGQRENPFTGFNTANTNFGNRQVVEINSLEDAVTLGIEKDGLMNGVPYYHIEKFFALAGNGQRLFVMFADCSSNFDAIEDLQVAAKGLCFQIGFWTERELFTKSGNDLLLATWVANVQTVAEKLGGRIKKQGQNYVNYDGNAQVSILINANPGRITDGQDATVAIDLSKLPNAIGEMPYVSSSVRRAQTTYTVSSSRTLASVLSVTSVSHLVFLLSLLYSTLLVSSRTTTCTSPASLLSWASVTSLLLVLVSLSHGLQMLLGRTLTLSRTRSATPRLFRRATLC